MRVETRPAGSLYHYYKMSRLFQNLHENDDFLPEPDVEIPGFLVYDYDNLDDFIQLERMESPVFEAFYALGMGLALPFQGGRFYLERSGGSPLPRMRGKPVSFEFRAYEDDEDSVPRVEYDRILFPGPVVFDELETGEKTIDDVIEVIEARIKKPKGEVLRLVFDDVSFTLQDGYDEVEWEKSRIQMYSNELSWHYGKVRRLRIEQDAPGVGKTRKDVELKEAVDMLYDRTNEYLAANSYL